MHQLHEARFGTEGDSLLGPQAQRTFCMMKRMATLEGR